MTYYYLRIYETIWMIRWYCIISYFLWSIRRLTFYQIRYIGDCDTDVDDNLMIIFLPSETRNSDGISAARNESASMLDQPEMQFFRLTHLGQDEMAAIFQTTSSNAFSWMYYGAVTKSYQRLVGFVVKDTTRANYVHRSRFAMVCYGLIWLGLLY